MKIFIIALLVGVVASIQIVDPLYDSEYLPVPGGGYRPVSCVHVVPNKSVIEKLDDGTLRVTSPDGSVLEYGKCPYAIPKHLVDNGWNVYASWSTAAPKDEVSVYNGNWTVPGGPTVQGGQTIFLFTGLQNMGVGNTEIIQPVLQWGPSAGGGGKYWSLASWYVPSSETHTLISPLEQVASGDLIYGTMILNSDSTWTISGIVEAQSIDTSITLKSNPIQDWAAVTLEAYSIGPCTQYPTGNVVFTGLYIEVAGTVTSPSWAQNVGFSNCGESVSISGPSSVTLEWTN